MNTIPSIFSLPTSSYTVVGGAVQAAFTGLSAILLNRGGRYPRRTLFQELEKTKFDYIVSVEAPGERYDVEELSSRFPFVKFILLKEVINLGEQINLAVSELTSPLFFVLWNDLRILNGEAARMAERLFYTREELSKTGDVSAGRRLCTIPVIQNAQFQILPTLTAPDLDRQTVRNLFLTPSKEGTPSLYPFDGVGVYDRDRFVKLGGFDCGLSSTYWQLMDFGFRAHLWGETIQSTRLIRLSYNGEVAPQDSTVDEDYRRFYLKNIAPVFNGDASSIPLRRFPRYFFYSGEGPFQAWDNFSQGRRWVAENKFRFRRDARALTDLWEYPENGIAGATEAAGENGVTKGENGIPKVQEDEKSAEAERTNVGKGTRKFRFGNLLVPKVQEKP
ncbi:MAG: hypothetical protein LBF74_03990 [Treponema sp.]|jgi:hypothetical protein|nr:hypothetical protein [Treponema sp.]